MFCPPLPHSLDVVRAAEVITVLRSAQPPVLAGPFAHGLTLGGGTIFLAPAIAVIRNEELLTIQTFAAGGRLVHWVVAPPG